MVARKPRDFPPFSVLHVISRGVERRQIFREPSDYSFFLSQMRDTFEMQEVSVLNYALMPNHFHLMVVTSKAPIGDAMQFLLTRYALRFNRENSRVGHLFQGRFRAFECADENYLVDLAVYITRNPVRAGLAENASGWEWTGHNELAAGTRRYLRIEALDGLGILSPEQWRRIYLERVSLPPSELPKDATLVELAQRSALDFGVSVQALLRGNSGAPYTMAKRALLREALARGYAQVDVAQCLGCTKAALTKLG